MSNKQRKKQNRVEAAEKKIYDWYYSNTKSRAVLRYFYAYGNPCAERANKLANQFKERYAKPAYDALVQRIVEHKQKVKELRKR